MRLARLALSVVALAFSLGLLGSGLEPAAAQEGVIAGRVVNGTAVSGPLPRLEVALLAIDQDGKTQTIASAPTDDQGAFRFQGVETGTHYYVVSTTYAGVRYSSEPVQLASSEAPEVTLMVYETTDKADGVSVAFNHALMEVMDVDGAGRSVNVLEFVQLVNSGDRTYIGSEGDTPGQRLTILFPLPTGAASLSLGPEFPPQEVVTTAEGFALTSPLVPGLREVSFGYLLPFEASEYRATKTLPYPTGRLVILMPETTVRLESSALATVEGGTVIEGQRYTLLRGEALAPGTTVDLRFRGLPLATSGSSWWERGRWPLVAALGAAALLALVYWRWQRRPTTLAAVPGKEQLLSELAELDRRYEAGDLREEEYRQRRSQTLKQLEAIW